MSTRRDRQIWQILKYIGLSGTKSPPRYLIMWTLKSPEMKLRQRNTQS